MTQPPDLTIELADAEATRALGQRLGAALTPGLVVALIGELGAGKTALSKAVIAAQGEVEEDDVPSPTFVLAIEYEGRVGVVHIDAYRLDGGASLNDLGYELHGGEQRAVLIEWADRVEDALPDDRLSIELEHTPPGRRATLRASGPRSSEVLEGLSP